MANEVRVKVILDDDGTIRLTEKSAKKLAGTLDRTGKSAKDVEKNVKGVAQTASAGGKQFAGLARGAGGVVAAYATLAAQVFAVDAAFRFLREGADLTRLYEGQIALAAATGTSYRNLAKDIQDATDAQISFKEASQSAAIGKAAGLTNEQLVQLGKTANEVSAVLGRDLTDSFNRLVRGVTKAEPELLDELGIILRLREATENYKEATGAVGELTAFQRTQAVTNEVLTQAEKKYGKLLAVIQPTQNSVARLGTVFEELVDDFQVFLARGLTPVLETLSEFPQLIGLAFGPFATKTVGAVIEPLSKAGDVIEKFADKTKTASVTSAALAKEQKAAAVAALQTGQQRAQAIAAQIASENKLRKDSLIKRIAEEGTLEKKQLQRFIRNLQKGSNANAIASDKIRADFIKALKAMEAQSGVTTVTLQTRFKALAASGAAAFASIKATAVSAFSTIVSVGTRALAVLSTFLSVASYVGLAIAIAGIVTSFFRAEKQIDKTAQALERLEEKLASVTEESQKFSAVQNELFGDLRFGGRVVQNFGGILENFSGEQIAKNLDGATAALKQYTRQNDELIKAEEKRVGNLQKLKKEQEELSTLQKSFLAIAFGGGLEGGEGFSLLDPETTSKQIETVQDKIILLQKKVTSEFLKTEEAAELFTREQLVGLGIITNELETLQKIENQYFRTSKTVMDYEQAAKDALNGNTDNFDTVVKTREAYQAFVAILREEQSIRDDINKKFSSFETSYLNVSEERAILSSLFQQKSLIAQQLALEEELNQEQQEFVDTANKKIEILERELDLQTRIQLAQKELENFTTQSLIGRTKLFSEEIKFRSSIRKSNIEITKLEGERAQIQSILTDKFEEQAKLEEKIAAATGLKKESLQADLQASEALTNASAQQLENIRLGIEAQEIKIEGLERELNLLAQIGDATKQALETSLSANIRDAILNKQDSIRDAFLIIVNSVAAAAANELANSLTKSLLSAIPGFDTQDPVQTAISENSLKLIANTKAINANTTALTGPQAAVEPSVLKAPGSDSTVQTKDVAQAAQSQAVAAAADPEKKGFFATLLGNKAEVNRQGNVGEVMGEDGVPVVAGVGGKPGKGLIGGLETIFGSFKDGLKTMFAKDGGFLMGLSEIFSGGIDGFGQIFSGLGQAFGGLFGGGEGGGLGGLIKTGLSLFGFGGVEATAMGGIYQGGISAFANGGIVTRPTMGLVGEAGQNEAVVPLPDGKAIPVNMNGTNNNNNVAVNINMATGQAETTGNDQQLAAFGNSIVDIVQREIADQTRPGGLLAR